MVAPSGKRPDSSRPKKSSDEAPRGSQKPMFFPRKSVLLSASSTRSSFAPDTKTLVDGLAALKTRTLHDGRRRARRRRHEGGSRSKGKGRADELHIILRSRRSPT